MERFTLTQIADRPGWWSVTDSRSGVRIDFEAGNFNDSQNDYLSNDYAREIAFNVIGDIIADNLSREVVKNVKSQFGMK